MTTSSTTSTSACTTETWIDPADTTGLDIREYGHTADCQQQEVQFTASTDWFPFDEFGSYVVMVDSDNNPGTGWDGVDRAAIVTQQSMLQEYGKVYRILDTGALGTQVGTFPSSIEMATDPVLGNNLIRATIPGAMLASHTTFGYFMYTESTSGQFDFAPNSGVRTVSFDPAPEPKPEPEPEAGLVVRSASYPDTWRDKHYNAYDDAFVGSDPPAVEAEVELYDDACWTNSYLYLVDTFGHVEDKAEFSQAICPGSSTVVSVSPRDWWHGYYYGWSQLDPGTYELLISEIPPYWSDPFAGEWTLLGEIEVANLEHHQMQASLDRDSAVEGQPIAVTAQLQTGWSDGTVEDAPGGWPSAEQLRLEFRPSSGQWGAVTGWRDAPTRSGTATFDATATWSGEYRIASRHGHVRYSNPVAVTVTAPDGASSLVSTAPTRIMDTRSGVGVPAGFRAPGEVVELTVAGVGDVPLDATAVVLNVTITQSARAGYVQVFPTGQSSPGASSNLNVERKGQTIPNQVTVPVGDGGKVSFYAQAGGHLVADMFGFYEATEAGVAEGRFEALSPSRLLDTRQSATKPAAKSVTPVQVTGIGGVPSWGVSAVVLNVTATQANRAGYVQAVPKGGSTGYGESSNLNVDRAGQTIANLVTVPVGDDGVVELYTSGGTHLIADVVGYYTDDTAEVSMAGLFVPQPPARVLDTRNPSYGTPKLGARGQVDFLPLGRGDVPSDGVSAVLYNVTAVGADGPGYVQVFPTGKSSPGASSNLNVERTGQTIPNAVLTATGDDGRTSLYTHSGTHLVLDVFGHFTD